MPVGEASVSIFAFEPDDVVIVGKGPCREEVLRDIRGIPSISVIVPAGLGASFNVPDAFVIDAEKLDHDAATLRRFSGRKVFLAGDVVLVRTRHVDIPDTRYHKAALVDLSMAEGPGTPMLRVYAAALEQACSDAGMIPQSLHRIGGRPHRMPLLAVANDLQGGHPRQPASVAVPPDRKLQALLQSRCDTYVTGTVQHDGEMATVRFEAPDDIRTFETAFVDATLISRCAEMGFRKFVIGRGVLILEPLGLGALCGSQQLVLVDASVGP